MLLRAPCTNRAWQGSAGLNYLPEMDGAPHPRENAPPAAFPGREAVSPEAGLLLTGTHLCFHTPPRGSFNETAGLRRPSQLRKEETEAGDFPVPQPRPAMRQESPVRGFPSPRVLMSPSGGPSAQQAILPKSLGKPRVDQGLPERQRRAGFLSHHLPPQQALRRKLKLQGEIADKHTLHTKVPISKTFHGRVPPRTVCKL